MNIVFFVNPTFFGKEIAPTHTSMPQYANTLIVEMQIRGHNVKLWQPKTRFFNLASYGKKWLGYIDQYIVFPVEVLTKMITVDKNVLFVFTDQSQGPWIHLVAPKRHIIHCHDLLAQLSAMDKVSHAKSSISGKLYQRIIRSGLTKGNNFISVSQKSKNDLERILHRKPVISEVIYNWTASIYKPKNKEYAKQVLNNVVPNNAIEDFILHVGGNQWYKNRIGVIKVFNELRVESKRKHQLVLIGDKPSKELQEEISLSPFKSEIYCLVNVSNEIIHAAYCGASLLLFPSIAEGFGWPIAEAMACGCPVVVTNAPPMNEVAGEAGIFIPSFPADKKDVMDWARQAAQTIKHYVDLSPRDKQIMTEAVIDNAKRFNFKSTMNRIEQTYLRAYTAKP